MEWLTLAKTLPTGQKTRTNCECGDGNTLIINHNVKAYSCYCFRCDFNDFEHKGKQTLEELAVLKQLNEDATKNELKLELPNDFTKEIPIAGRLWLYKAGITEPVWKSYGIGYSEHLKRVVLPVYDKEGSLVWFQCRALIKGQKPKYIQPSRGRDSVLFCGRSDHAASRSVVIVEDILSAIRTDKHIRTVSLLGTKITSNQAARIAKFDKVYIWLDPDRAGTEGSYRIAKTLGLITEVSIIRSTKDPKELSDVEIKEILWNNYLH